MEPDELNAITMVLFAKDVSGKLMFTESLEPLIVRVFTEAVHTGAGSKGSAAEMPFWEASTDTIWSKATSGGYTNTRTVLASKVFTPAIAELKKKYEVDETLEKNWLTRVNDVAWHVLPEPTTVS